MNINLNINYRYIIGKRFHLAAYLSLALLGGTNLYANEPIYVEPLFEYPVAPEEIDGLMEKSDYLMQHFWDKMDFSKNESVDQNALNDAFHLYASTMTFASRDAVLASVNDLVKKIKPNSTLTVQFVKAAEDSFYGPRAEMWSDEVYIPFLKTITANKKVSETRRARYAAQLSLLERMSPNARFPKIRMTLRDGRHKDFEPEKNRYTLVEFGNPDCDDCRFAKTKLTMATDLEDMLQAGELDIVFIVADAVPEDQTAILEQFKSYPDNWIAGISYGADDVFDLRTTPSFYLLDKKGRIAGKNLDVMDAVKNLRNMIEKDKK